MKKKEEIKESLIEYLKNKHDFIISLARLEIKQIYKEYYEAQIKAIDRTIEYYKNHEVVTKEFIKLVIQGDAGGEHAEEIIEYWVNVLDEEKAEIEKKYKFLSEIEHDEDIIIISYDRSPFSFRVWDGVFEEAEIDLDYETEKIFEICEFMNGYWVDSYQELRR